MWVCLHMYALDFFVCISTSASTLAPPSFYVFEFFSWQLGQVRIGLRVLTRPMPDQLPKIYRNLGENFNERVLPSIIHETLKAVVAQYNASQLITQREVPFMRLDTMFPI
jgi:hypothetical protein